MTVSLDKTATTEVDRVAIDHIRVAVEDLDATRNRIADLKTQETELLAVIKAAIGTHHIGTIGGEDAVRLDERTNSSIDRVAVKALLGDEAYSSVLKLTPYTATVVVGKFKRGGKK